MNTPLYFGPAAQPLFGMLHLPAGAMRNTAVLLCPSWGAEYQRAYRGMRQLAQSLTHRGFPVLRFDYSGTGDSAGENGAKRINYWIEDIRVAAQELRRAAQVDGLCLLGLRFGALLAQEAIARGKLEANAVTLWDSPPSGEVFVRNLRQLDAALNEKRSQQRRHDSQLPPAHEELLGHPWPEQLSEEISGLPGLREDLPGPVIFVSRDRTPPENVASIRLPDAGHWSDLEYLGSPWLPTPSFRIVADQLAAVLP